MGLSNNSKGIEVLEIMAPSIGGAAAKSYYEEFMTGARTLPAVQADIRSPAR